MITPTSANADEIADAHEERAYWASWFALCELQPQPKDTATPAGFHRWCRAVNKLAKKKYEQVN